MWFRGSGPLKWIDFGFLGSAESGLEASGLDHFLSLTHSSKGQSGGGEALPDFQGGLI